MRVPLAVSVVLMTLGCASRAATRDADPLVARFRARAEADEIARFERLRASADETERADALQMVLFRLTDDELYEIGVTQSHQPCGPEWAVAWSVDPDRDYGPILAALDRAGLPCGGSGNLNGLGVYIRRELFFEAMRALIDSADVQARVAAGSLKVVEPRFRLG